MLLVRLPWKPGLHVVVKVSQVFRMCDRAQGRHAHRLEWNELTHRRRCGLSYEDKELRRGLPALEETGPALPDHVRTRTRRETSRALTRPTSPFSCYAQLTFV